MERLKNLKGVKVLSRESQKTIGGGGACDTICGSSENGFVVSVSKWACGCSPQPVEETEE